MELKQLLENNLNEERDQIENLSKISNRHSDVINTKNPFQELLKNTNAKRWDNRDIGKEVMGLSNAKQLTELNSDLKNFKTQSEKASREFEKRKGKFFIEKRKIEDKADDYLDVDKKGKKELTEKYNQLIKDYKNDIKEFEKEAKRLSSLLEKGVEKMKKYEVELAKAEQQKKVDSNKKETKDISNAKKKEMTDNWKEKVKSFTKK